MTGVVIDSGSGGFLRGFSLDLIRLQIPAFADLSVAVIVS